jgi:hypothetical protein
VWVDPNGEPFNMHTAAAQESSAHEIMLMRRQLAGVQKALAEAEKESAAARAALSTEQAKTLRLEAECAEVQQRLAGHEERAADAAADAARAAHNGNGLPPPPRKGFLW